MPFVTVIVIIAAIVGLCVLIIWLFTAFSWKKLLMALAALAIGYLILRSVGLWDEVKNAELPNLSE